MCVVCFCKQKTAYELRISDWSSDVCSSDRSAPNSGDPSLELLRLCVRRGIGIRFNFATSRHIDQTSLTLQPSLNGMSKAENDEGKKDRSRRSSLRHRARARSWASVGVCCARARRLTPNRASATSRRASGSRAISSRNSAKKYAREKHFPDRTSK